MTWRRCSIGGLLVLALVGAVSCAALDDELGEVSAAEFALADCGGTDALSFAVRYLDYHACDDWLYLRAQEDGTSSLRTDGVEIQVPAYDQVKEALEAGPVTLRVEEGAVRVGLFLNRQCEESFAPLEAVSGEVTIEALSLSVGGTVRLSGTVVVEDSRDHVVVTPALTFDVDTSASDRWPKKSFPVCE